MYTTRGSVKHPERYVLQNLRSPRYLRAYVSGHLIFRAQEKLHRDIWTLRRHHHYNHAGKRLRTGYLKRMKTTTTAFMYLRRLLSHLLRFSQFYLFSYGIAQVSLRYPNCTGGIAPQVHLLSRRGKAKISSTKQVSDVVEFGEEILSPKGGRLRSDNQMSTSEDPNDRLKNIRHVCVQHTIWKVTVMLRCLIRSRITYFPLGHVAVSRNTGPLSACSSMYSFFENRHICHWARIHYSIHSQKYHGCNQFHYSHVINSGELQDCNWNCNCNVIHSSESEPLFCRETESQSDNT